MLDILLNEPETFNTPDGRLWEINPLKRKDLVIMNKFTTINDKIQAMKKDGNTGAGNELVFGTGKAKEDTLIGVTDEIIDLSIREVNTGKRFPEEYRENIGKAIELCNYVIKATVGLGEGDGSPLAQRSSGSE